MKREITPIPFDPAGHRDRAFSDQQIAVTMAARRAVRTGKRQQVAKSRAGTGNWLVREIR